MSGHFSSVVLNAYGAAREGLARAEERLALLLAAKVSVIDAVELTSALP